MILFIFLIVVYIEKEDNDIVYILNCCLYSQLSTLGCTNNTLNSTFEVMANISFGQVNNLNCHNTLNSTFEVLANISFGQVNNTTFEVLANI